jgi:hypothetical protein
MRMVYRKGELTKARINRDWPHQLALPVAVATGEFVEPFSI